MEYWAHGWQVASDVRLPWATGWQAPLADWCVTADWDASFAKPMVEQGAVFSAAPGRLWLALPRLARMQLTQAKVGYQLHAGASAQMLVAQLLGPAVAVQAYMQGQLALSGSAVTYAAGSAFAVTGSAGVGKTEWIWQWLRQQASSRLLSDGCVVLKPQAMVYPGTQQLMLWEASVRRAAYDPSVLRRVHPDLSYYFVPVPRVADAPAQLTDLFVLQLDKLQKTHCQQAKGMQAFSLLEQQLLHARFNKGLGLLPQQFKALQQAANQVRIWRLTVNEGQRDFSAITDCIQRALAQQEQLAYA